MYGKPEKNDLIVYKVLDRALKFLSKGISHEYSAVNKKGKIVQYTSPKAAAYSLPAAIFLAESTEVKRPMGHSLALNYLSGLLASKAGKGISQFCRESTADEIRLFVETAQQALLPKPAESHCMSRVSDVDIQRLSEESEITSFDDTVEEKPLRRGQYKRYEPKPGTKKSTKNQ